ncbi:MmpS family transport accessory protein [Mycobacteroides abscessus]|uniref:MmpS family transport accessory protein n=1 Tax=Mycobacteroides abscessus TaxID=36809 RepID=UPI0009A793FE|nr:MmpS family transport accessory protein [Mycobacteroides abscessus]MDO3066734.1 MmpS family transport accessory protein [Mycobacteroides abscessus subsp. bolletii]SKN32992.1 membrane protein [Mycobacteroides abscessus subsp. bolletii]SKX05000.1 membrane protein [Mycobacteroides abscessus subsp. bolletii]
MAFPRGLGAFGRKVIRHGWLVVVIAVVASLASVSVMRVRALSAPSGPVVSPKGAPKLPSFAPKHVVYMVFGESAGTGTLTYLDVDSRPHRVDFTTLPWTHEEVTTRTSMLANLMAQSTGDELGCRIIVNGEVRDEQVQSREQGSVACKVKSA